MERRPLDVVLIAIYYAGFSAVLLGIILWQWLGGHIHGSWQEKVLVLPFCFLLAILPGVLAVGLWMLDNAARLGAILFALLHTLTELAFLSNPHVPSRAFTVFRIVLNGVIIACLCRPGVRKAFKWQPLGLSLRGGGPA
jgi:hypothetical protein